MTESEFYEKRNQLVLNDFWKAKLATFSPVSIVYLESLWSKRPAQLDGLAALAKRKAELFTERRIVRMQIFDIPFTKCDGQRAVISKRLQAIQAQIEKIKIAERNGRKAGVVETIVAKAKIETWTLDKLKLEKVRLCSRIAKKRTHLKRLETSDVGLTRVATAQDKLKQLLELHQNIVHQISKCSK